MNTQCIILYSTHSHKPGKPRYRIIIPLVRPVTPDEYVPIALKIADNLGLDNFDDTTYQPYLDWTTIGTIYLHVGVRQIRL